MHADGKSTLASVSKWISVKVNSRPKLPTKVETKRKLQQFTVSRWLIIKGEASDSEKGKL